MWCVGYVVDNQVVCLVVDVRRYKCDGGCEIGEMPNNVKY